MTVGTPVATDGRGPHVSSDSSTSRGWADGDAAGAADAESRSAAGEGIAEGFVAEGSGVGAGSASGNGAGSGTGSGGETGNGAGSRTGSGGEIGNGAGSGTASGGETGNGAGNGTGSGGETGNGAGTGSGGETGNGAGTGTGSGGETGNGAGTGTGSGATDGAGPGGRAQRGFLALLLTQFLGAANDNVLKQVLTFMVATGLWAGALGRGGQAYVALCLTIPFILLSGIAGQFADRHSKRRVMVIVKVAEIPIAIVAAIGFVTGNLWTTLIAMLLLAIQSTFFGPAKYGVIPELVGDAQLSRANGLLNMLTNVAIITGSLLAGPISDAYFPDEAALEAGATSIRWLPGAALVAIALLGLVAVLAVPPLEPQDRRLTYDWNPLGTYLDALREMAGTPLLLVAIAWSYFYMVGMLALLILPEYQAILGISFGQTSLLLGIMGVAIGVGSAAAGFLSGPSIRTGLVPVGAAGMTVAFAALGLAPPRFGVVAALIALAGCSAGFYIVPLQALLQHLSPDRERGRFLGTANALSFLCSSIGAGIYWLTTNPLAMPPNRVFLVCAALTAVGIAGYLKRPRGT